MPDINLETLHLSIVPYGLAYWAVNVCVTDGAAEYVASAARVAVTLTVPGAVTVRVVPVTLAGPVTL